MSYDTTNQIKSNWIERAKNETDPFNKFISYWVAFNCWYSSRYPYKRDGECIKKIKDDVNNGSLSLVFEDECKNSLNNLKLKSSRKVLQDRNPSPISIKNNGGVINWVYIVRNNLFHGNKLDSNERDKVIIEAANKIMEKIISELVKKYD